MVFKSMPISYVFCSQAWVAYRKIIIAGTSVVTRRARTAVTGGAGRAKQKKLALETIAIALGACKIPSEKRSMLYYMQYYNEAFV